MFPIEGSQELTSSDTSQAPRSEFILRFSEGESNQRFPGKISSKSKHFRNTLLFPPRNEPQIQFFCDGIDVTPKRIVYSKQYNICGTKYDLELEQPVHSQRKSRAFSVSRISRVSSLTQRLSEITEYRGNESRQVSPKHMTAQSFTLINIKIDPNIVCNIGNQIEQGLEEKGPSAFYLPRMSSKIIFPTEFKLFLEETETFFLFEMPSITVPKGSAEGDSVEKENEVYDYLTIGKGRNRKTITTEAQTLACIQKTRHTIAPRTEKINNSAFASVWDMFDSYKNKDKENKDTLIDSIKSNDDLSENHLMDGESKSDRNLSKEENKINKILNSSSCLNALMMMERVIANNNYMVEQEDFKGLLRSDDESTEESFDYELMLLWTFSYYKIEQRSVTTMCINTLNTDIIAVGYGKFEYSDNTTGIICIWSIKNPTQPERLYNFKVPVTSTAFSEANPNLLAIGFYNGDVVVLDITSYEKNIIASSSRKSSPSYQPIWHVRWFYTQDFHPDVEQVISVGHDGRINCFLQTKTQDFLCTAMMRIKRTEGNVKSIYEEDWCVANEIPILRNTNCIFYCPHPNLEDIYFVGTSDGYIYKCSTNYMNQHISFFLAHDGPVYGMQFSHYCKQIFITCGADWTVKIWKENVSTPLVVLTTDMNPVMGAVFCPTHSTVIAAVSGTSVYIWNIKEKIDTATLVTELPEGLSKLTKILFTKNGKNLIISDVKGGVHMYALLGITEAGDNQDEILQDTLHNILLIRPELLQKMKKADKKIE